MNADLLRSKFEQGLAYPDYLATGTAEQQRRWNDVAAKLSLTADQKTQLGGFTRTMQVLVVSGIWCGDCVAQGPMFDLIVSAAPQAIHLRIVDRDQHKDLATSVQINGGLRVPTVIFMAEDFEFCGLMGDRTLSRYRAIAARQLGASCPVGIVPPADNELAETLAEWVCEFERIQLMLRLSPRLRHVHAD